MVNLGAMAQPLDAYGHILRTQAAVAVGNYIDNIPNMSHYELGQSYGYGVEKIIEGVLLTRGAGVAVNGVRYGTITSGRIGKYGYIFAKHGPHHPFRSFGGRRLPHFQLNVWKYGVKRSGRTIFRIPTLPPR
jgi:hypothetical protein